MAALSYYNSNWAALEQEFNSTDTSFLAPAAETELNPELFHGDFGFPDVCCNNVNNLFEPNNDFFYSDNLNCNLVNTQEEFEPFHAPKRQRLTDINYEQLIYPEFFEPGLINYGFQDYSPEFSTPPPVAAPPPGTRGGGRLSTQSIAARQRRRKISEKTQELSKLVPGGQKMNTAEMFQSAYKYIKFLKAQVGILESMGSSFDKELFQSEELHGFLESPLIQEKLYSVEKCLVPEKFVQTLANDHGIMGSKPDIAKKIEVLVAKNTCEVKNKVS